MAITTATIHYIDVTLVTQPGDLPAPGVMAGDLIIDVRRKVPDSFIYIDSSVFRPYVEKDDFLPLRASGLRAAVFVTLIRPL